MARAMSQHFSLGLKKDMHIPGLADLLQPKLWYVGNKSSLLSGEMLREAYMLAAIYLKRAGDKQPTEKTKDPPKFKVRDLLFLKNHKKQTWGNKIYAQLLYL